MTTDPTTADTFLHRTLPHVGKRVHRLGLAGNYGIDARGAAAAFERGLGYVFWTPRMAAVTDELKAALRRDRAGMVVATGPTLGMTGGQITRAAERLLRLLDIDQIDVFQIFWLGRSSAWTAGTQRALERLKSSGKAKTIGVSIHDRPRAGQMAADMAVDLLMIRYNAAHPGAERDIFPRFGATRPAVTAYTATAWRRLLKAPRGWDGPVPTAGDCYRFCLSNPLVDVTLCGPASTEQLDENLAALERGPLSDDEMMQIRAFGEAVHASGGLVSRFA